MTIPTWRAALVAGLAGTALAPVALGLLPTAAASDHDPEPSPECSSDPGGQSGERCPSPGPDPEPDPHASRNPHMSPSPSASPSADASPTTAAPTAQPDETGCRDSAGGHAEYVRRSAADAVGSMATLVIFLGGSPAEQQAPVPSCPGVTYTVTMSDYESGETLHESSMEGNGLTGVVTAAAPLVGYGKQFVRIAVTVTETVDGVLVTHDSAANDVVALLSPGSGGQIWK